MKIIINQVIDRFRFKPRLNNTLGYSNFVSSEFGSTNFNIKCQHKHFLAEFDKNTLTMRICYDLKNQPVKKKT